MTHQEIFNKVWNHFVNNKGPQAIFNEEGQNMCRYRADMTASCPTRCAIGLFIPDEVYKPSFDDGSLGLKGVIDHVPELKAFSDIDMNCFYALHNLQRCHDSADPEKFHEGVEKNLRTHAENYQLVIPDDNAV